MSGSPKETVEQREERLRLHRESRSVPKRLDISALSKVALHDSDLGHIYDFFEEIKLGSDRSMAILMTAALDQLLTENLVKRFRPMTQKQYDEQFFGKHANFGTMSIKSDLCYLLSIIDEWLKRDLDVIRKIRNAFAHGTYPLTFDHETVKPLLQRLSLVEKVEVKDLSPRQVFFDGAIRANMALLFASNKMIPSASLGDVLNMPDVPVCSSE